mmetsp:Transcript_5721/g.17479  ORF Transcript_5721/g.17479 Transcript_5721/m.17479 type:complete len:282 (+) Transcript_5721:935-1780(+)
MLAMMTAVLRLMGVSPCRMPRTSNGTMMASAGASTLWTNVVADSLAMVSPTSDGRAMQLSIGATHGSMSRLPLSLNAALIAFHAAFLTCSRGSIRHSPAFGTISGSAAATWSGATTASCFSSFSAPSLACHVRLFIASYSIGITTGTASRVRLPTSAPAAAHAASRTPATLSPMRSSSSGSSGTVYGSAALPTPASPATARSAPSRAAASWALSSASRRRRVAWHTSSERTPATAAAYPSSAGSSPLPSSRRSSSSEICCTSPSYSSAATPADSVATCALP